MYILLPPSNVEAENKLSLPNLKRLPLFFALNFNIFQSSHTLVTEADIITPVKLRVGRDRGTNGQVTVTFVVSFSVNCVWLIVLEGNTLQIIFS